MASINPPRSAAALAEARRPGDRDPAEPATAQALWPTFLRRTIADDDLPRSAAAERPRERD